MSTPRSSLMVAGDIGGTKALIALFEDQGGRLRLLRERTFTSAAFGSLYDVLAVFFEGAARPPLHAACFGVPGTVIDGRCETTNLPWVVEETALVDTLRGARIKLLNDLEAMAYGTLHLEADELAALNTVPCRPQSNAALIAAGTGLGEAMLYWDGHRHHPVASEGGHADFAARTEEEGRLLQYLQRKLGGHVSYERVLSGPGLLNIYEFLRDSGYAPEPEWLAAELGRGDPSATIAQVGMAGRSELCVHALDIFASVYGAEAGNLALRYLALGGVFLGGGIAPKLLSWLQRGEFMRAFADKGRFTPFLHGVGVRVALNPRTAVLGAAHYAARL